MRNSITATVIAAIVLACGYTATVARAELLIAPNEANRPDAAAPDTLRMRGLTRGPAIEQISPDPGSKDIKSPLVFKIRFIAHNNTTVDPNSVTVTYLKSPAVDLTARIKTHLTATGIEMSDAEVPPGAHLIRIELKDSQGRAGVGIIKLSVTP